MIVGIGTDLIEIERIRKAYQKESFRTRYYTTDEIIEIGASSTRAAGNFAAKEACSKVFGTGFVCIRPIEIEVLRDPLGKPYLNLYGKAKQLAQAKGIDVWHVSITNTKEYAQSFVVGEENSIEKSSKCTADAENRCHNYRETSDT